MQVLYLYGPRKSKPKTELRKQQYTVTLFDCSHLAHVSILWQCKNLCFTVQFLLCVILNLRAISKYKPPGACIWRGDLSGGFLRFEFGGPYTGRGLFTELYGICVTVGNNTNTDTLVILTNFRIGIAFWFNKAMLKLVTSPFHCLYDMLIWSSSVIQPSVYGRRVV